MTTWVVVADTVRARIFSVEKRRGPLEEIEVLAHPEGRLHERELTSDLPGRSFDSGGQGRHAMESESGPKQEEAIRFAKEVCGTLTSARQSGRFDKLYVVAAPTFLGLLRDSMDAPTRQLVAGEIDKSLARHTPDQIRSHLPDYL